MRLNATTFVWVFMYVLTLTTMLGWLYMQRSTDEDRISRMIEQLTREEGKYKSASAEFDRMMDDLNEQIDSLEQQIKASKTDVQQLRDQKNDLEGQKTTLQQQTRQIQYDLSLCDQNAASLRAQVSSMGRDVRLAMAAREKDRDARTRLTAELNEKERAIDILESGLNSCLRNKTMLLHKISKITHNTTLSCAARIPYLSNSTNVESDVKWATLKNNSDTHAVDGQIGEQHDRNSGMQESDDSDVGIDTEDEEAEDQVQSHDAILQAVVDGRIFEYVLKSASQRPSWDSQFFSFISPRNETKICLLVPLLIPEDGGHTQLQDDALEKLLQVKALNTSDTEGIANYLRIIVVHDIILPQHRMQSLQSNISIPVEFIKADWAGNLKSHSYEKENEILLSHILSPWFSYSGLSEKCSYVYLDDTHGKESPSDYLSLVPEIYSNLLSRQVVIAHSHVHEIRQRHLLTLVSRFCTWANIEQAHIPRGNITDQYGTTMVPSYAGHLVIQTDFLLSDQVQALIQFIEVSKGAAYFEWSSYAVAWILSSLFVAGESIVPLIDICI